jgi:hypothetical protein
MVIMRYLHSWQGKALLKVISIKLLRQKERLIGDKNRQANESKLAPSTVQISDTTYYLNKGETITFR